MRAAARLMQGRLFAVVGPSGAGKDTLIAAAKAARPDLFVARRVITRPTSAGGEDFVGVDAARFAQMQAAGAFALVWRAHGLSYGIPADILTARAEGRDVVFNGSRAALPLALARFADLRVILVTAPPAVLAQRLAGRGRETAEDIARRLTRAGFALPEGIAAIEVQNGGTLAEGVANFLAALQPPSG